MTQLQDVGRGLAKRKTILLYSQMRFTCKFNCWYMAGRIFHSKLYCLS